MPENKIPLEKDEQKDFFKYAKDLYGIFPLLEFLLFATMSGSWLHGSKTQRMKQVASEKAQGRKNGVADVLCLIQKRGYAGLVIEMKRREGGKVSDAQKAWIAAAEKAGYYTAVCFGSDEAIDTLNYYLELA